MITHRASTILGDIPAEWERQRLTNLLQDNQAGDWGDDVGDIAIGVLRSTNFRQRGVLDRTDVATRYFATDKAKSFGLQKHDLLLERSGGGPAQPVGRVGFVSHDLPATWFSNFVQVLRADPGKVNPEYLGWVLVELHRSGIIERLQHQTTQMRNLEFRDYLRVYLPKPSPDEQRIIARVLNLASEAITTAEQKIETARRVRLALLQELFTRGIPGAHARLKSARVMRHHFEVPESWSVEPLRASVSRVEYGTNVASNDSGHGLPVIAIPQVVESRFRLGDCPRVELPKDEAGALRLEPDDVLLVRTNGNPEYIGKSTVLGPEAATQHVVFASYLIRVRTIKDKLSGTYLNYFLASPLGRRQCLAMANTSAGNHNLGSRAIKNFCLPRPTPEEQARIVSLVDAAEDAVEAAEAEADASERVLRSLLQNVVIGKVRLNAGGIG